MYEIFDLKYKNILNIKYCKINEQEVTCIVGMSGSGKTTFLKMLNKIISPDSGIIKYKGFSLDDIDSISLRQKVVMLPQSTIIYPGNLRDNLLLGIKFCKKEIPSDEMLISTLKNLDVHKELDDDPSMFSGGEKQRVCLARIMLMDCSTYLFDEPCSALDSTTEDFITKNIVDFAKENNKTLIMVTHSEKVAYKFGHHIIHIELGRIKQEERLV